MPKKYILIGIAVAALLTSGIVVLAGSIDSPAEPSQAASQMYTLDQIYHRIDDGTAVTKMTTFTEPSSGPGSTMHTLDGIYELAGHRSRPAKTGQTTSYASKDDGDLEKGVAWPDPRFTDNGNGTVTDNLTGLIWLKDANCFGAVDWATALSDANTLNSGECGLSDGSVEGDWRLPNVRELHSLIDYGRSYDALPSGHPFDNVQASMMGGYLTSTTYIYWAGVPTDRPWVVSLDIGEIVGGGKTSPSFLLPVRGRSGASLASGVVVPAGPINSPAGPAAPASQMHTLDHIYHRLDDGTSAAKMTTFTEPSSGAGSTMHTLDQIYSLAGQRSRPAKTGQTDCYMSADPWEACTCGTADCPSGQDGDLEKGVTWPDPRFTDNGNGAVTDNLTGLIWLKEANCFGAVDWAEALSDANTLNSGECGLSVGSVGGDWRLPNVRELLSLIDFGRAYDALPSGHPFYNVPGESCWTSTTYDLGTSSAWTVAPYLGETYTYYKTGNVAPLWPVRGGP